MGTYIHQSFIVVLVALLCSSVMAESEFICGTVSNSQNQALELTLENTENCIVDDNSPIKHLRLSIYVARTSSGTNPASNASLVEQAVSHVNDRFFSHRIQFDYEWQYVDDDSLRSIDYSYMSPEFGDMNPDNINILVTETTPSYSWVVFGGRIYMNENTFNNDRNVLIHELGHVLDLYHTFEGALFPADSCYSVWGTPRADNSNCDRSGDYCCDTPTYPEWNSCANPEGIGGNDPCSGIPWGTIDDRNYMSYIDDECREEFTPQQSERMHSYLSYKTNLWYYDSLLVPLQYESIQSAIDDARDGDLIVVAPGIYSENINFSGKRIVVKSISGNPENTTIQAGDSSLPVVSFVSGEPETTTLDGFTVTSSHASGIRCQNSSPRIINNIIENNRSNCDSCGAGIDIRNAFGARIKNNIIRNNEAKLYGSAIYADICKATRVINNLIYGNKGSVDIFAVASNLIVYNNTIDGSTSNSHALTNQDRGATLECRNNSFVNVNQNVIVMNGIDHYRIEFNNFWNCKEGPLGGDYYFYDTLTNLEVDPVWAIGPCNDKWYCYIVDSINSPLIGAGSTHRSNEGSSINIGWQPTLKHDIPTDVDIVDDVVLPSAFQLSQNYPNPFNPNTNIEYSIPTRSHVKIEIVNLLGQKVRTLIDESKPAGEHQVIWDGNDSNGQSVSSGIYFYRLRAGDSVESKKMILLK